MKHSESAITALPLPFLFTIVDPVLESLGLNSYVLACCFDGLFALAYNCPPSSLCKGIQLLSLFHADARSCPLGFVVSQTSLCNFSRNGYGVVELCAT